MLAPIATLPEPKDATPHEGLLLLDQWLPGRAAPNGARHAATNGKGGWRMPDGATNRHALDSERGLQR